MICAWKEFLALLPDWLRKDVDVLGRDTLQELRLRLNMPPELVCGSGSKFLQRKVRLDDLKYCINIASRYSPWTAESAAMGYITAAGGHRMGLCGDVILSGGEPRGIRSPTSLCIRVARDFPGISGKLASEKESILILGSPGCGKTTLLRDLIRQISNRGPGGVAVVDERGELFPVSQGQACFSSGDRTDILTGSPKAQGIDMVLRTMGPQTVGVDEITAQADCDALIHAGWCGVRLLATAHASCVGDLRARPVYRKLWDCKLFQRIVVLNRDKTWTTERMM